MTKTSTKTETTKPPTKGTKTRNREKYDTPADKFKGLGQKRVNAALRSIRLIGNLSGPSYESTPDQVATIKAALQDAIDRAFLRFERTKKTEESFKL